MGASLVAMAKDRPEQDSSALKCIHRVLVRACLLRMKGLKQPARDVSRCG